MTRARFLGLGAASALAMHGLVAACGGDVVLGDDTSEDAAPPEGGASDGGAREDARADASAPEAAAAAPTCASEGGTCAPSGVGTCTKVDATGLVCSAGEICCLVSCPELQQPPPGFCDGGPVAQTYSANGCVTGFACAPVTCASAGGACVGLAPGTCTSNHVGDANRYSCGGGLGTMCCLP